ncbi:hypothetical protein [Kitasatospora sp. GAS204B]|uniref:hypothetical protein n=1 Tax=unclassified Kitasatospora TaxID=2633591 RepID=UPI002475D459|nr:hypothetical protein [Kitasatospora sp. GAS204B]MDH6120327.1 hypothetical protein [Kitasatospora sp. GAS204B]
MSLRIALGFDALRERCQVADVRTAHGDPEYEDGAVLPLGPWRPVTLGTGAHVTSTEETPDSVLVELVEKIDRAQLDRLDVTQLGTTESPAKALTTTPNYRDGRRIGLHLDNWDKLTYAAKHTGRRRLCINLGPGSRYLLLGDTDIQAICRAVHQDYATRYPHTDDLRAYVAAGRPLRCLRIRLEPGEGYVAPTEYLPHDGSTDGQQHSTAAFWLGRWPRGTFGRPLLHR